VSPTCQGYETRNWLILLVIAAGLVGGALAFFLWPPDPDPPKPVPPKPIARLVTQTISTGLAGIIVSIKAADARRFEIRYVMERDARPMSDATRITNSVDGGDDGR
jgi:hypothetical protein